MVEGGGPARRSADSGTTERVGAGTAIVAGGVLQQQADAFYGHGPTIARKISGFILCCVY